MRSTFTDEELVQQYLETRQNRHFEPIYNRYRQKVWRKCLSFVKDADQADDLTQEVFVRMLLKLHSYKREAKFSSWLYAITTNYCTGLTQSKHRRYEVRMDDAGGEANAPAEEEPTESVETQVQYVELALDQLPVEDQEFLRLKYQNDVSIQVLAESYNLTESAVKMRLKRSRDKLREIYQQVTEL